ncbi:MAG TPA: DNA repair protein RecO [Thermomicrobiales bacterium]|nr:DNA repair protein RecO [Thermomicrobiales bacterium]
MTDQPQASSTSSEPVARVRPPLSERLYRTEAIVLGKLNLGEADRILTIFTPHYGKVRVIAKGVRKARSKLGPHLELFTRCQLNLTRGRDLDVVTSAETHDAYVTLRDDLDVLGHASHMVELVARLTEDRQEQEPVYDLLRGSLRLLADGLDPFAVTRHFEFALLSALGYRPELYRCLNCDRPLEAELNLFSINLGGMLCPDCRATDPRAVGLSLNAQKYLREMDRNGLVNVIKLRLPPDTQRELEAVLGGYLRHLTERDLTSLDVTREIRRSLASQVPPG